MVLFDVNVLVHAHHEDAPNHTAYRDWLSSVVGSDAAYGLSELVLGGFLRVVTNPRVFTYPSPTGRALEFASVLRGRSNCVRISPGERHWDIFAGLCRAANAKGNIVADAYLAALAIESGSEWITSDHDFARFPGLRWRHPLETA